MPVTRVEGDARADRVVNVGGIYSKITNYVGNLIKKLIA